MQPDTKYARLGEDHIAYQVMGEGPIDFVVAAGSFGSIEMEWEDPEIALFNRRWASVCRVIRYDRRGVGASDPVPLDNLPPWESSLAEMLAVMDAAGSERAVLAAVSDGGPVAMLAAATKPERVHGLILWHSPARFLWADDYPIGLPPESVAGLDQMMDSWGTQELAQIIVPSRAGDERFMRWWARFMRSFAGPSAARAYYRKMLEIDARSLLPAIHVPTLVMHRTGYQIPIELDRYVAEHIEGARFQEIPGADPMPWFEHPELFIQAGREFLNEIQPEARTTAPSDRVMATLMFTDIAASTERAQAMGDAEWRHLLELHDEVSQRCVGDFSGRVVKTTGDGILATFEGPGRGILCASSLGRELGRVGLPIRAGVHTGEIELRGDDVGGVAVHIAARVMAAAGPDEIVVSRTVRDLVFGSDITFEDRGSHRLKGVDGEWQLFVVVGA